MDKSNQLGKLGELLLEKWATEVGLTVNKAHSDREGWDHLIEWPLPKPGTGVPLDRTGAPLQCFIQVKATKSVRNKISVPLRNWTKLCHSSLPSFFLILEFDDDNECGAGYLVHVWADEITRVLKRLRTLSTSTDAPVIGSQTLALSWADDQRLSAPSGVALRQAIESHVTPYGEYSQRKATLLKTVGGNAREGTVRVLVPEEYRSRTPQDLIDDLALGLLSEIETTGAELWDVRFGIKAHPPEKIDTKGKITRAPSMGLDATLKFVRGLRSTAIECRVYAAVGDLAIRSGRARFETRFIDLLLELSKGTVEVKVRLPRYDEIVPIPQLSEMAATILLFTDTQTGSDHIRFSCNEWELGTLLAADIVLPADVIEFANLGRIAARVASSAGLKDATCSPQQLFDQKETLQMLDALTRGGLGGAMVTLPATVAIGTEACMPVIVPLWLASRLILTPCLHFGTASHASINGEAGVWMEVHSSKALDPIIRENEESFSEDDFISVIGRISGAYAGSAEVVRWWDDKAGDSNANGA